MPTNRKVWKKNQIPKYHTFSPERTMKKIQDRLMKNFLTQWDTKKENQKILNMFGEKLSNFDKRQKRKTGKDQAIEKSKTSLPT